jgi:hypothetical protein
MIVFFFIRSSGFFWFLAQSAVLCGLAPSFPPPVDALRYNNGAFREQRNRRGVPPRGFRRGAKHLVREARAQPAPTQAADLARAAILVLVPEPLAIRKRR